MESYYDHQNPFVNAWRWLFEWCMFLRTVFAYFWADHLRKSFSPLRRQEHQTTMLFIILTWGAVTLIHVHCCPRTSSKLHCYECEDCAIEWQTSELERLCKVEWVKDLYPGRPDLTYLGRYNGWCYRYPGWAGADTKALRRGCTTFRYGFQPDASEICGFYPPSLGDGAPMKPCYCNTNLCNGSERAAVKGAGSVWLAATAFLWVVLYIKSRAYSQISAS